MTSYPDPTDPRRTDRPIPAATGDGGAATPPAPGPDFIAPPAAAGAVPPPAPAAIPSPWSPAAGGNPAGLRGPGSGPAGPAGPVASGGAGWSAAAGTGSTGPAGPAGSGWSGAAGSGWGWSGGSGTAAPGGTGTSAGAAWPYGPAPATTAPAATGDGGRKGRGVVAAAILAAVLAGGAAGAGVAALAGDDAGTTALPRAAGVAAPARAAGSLADVAQRVLPSVVSVQVRSGSGGGTGSGFVLDAAGNVLTNAHVVDGADSISVVDSTGRTRAAELVGVDSANDLAVIRVGAGLPAVTIGSSADLAVGDPVLAVGSPLGLSGTVTAGIVSATDRAVRFGDGRSSTAIQTDASINPGNSGGPLVDGTGRVVGVNTQIATLGQGSGNIGIGFAIPVDRAADVAERLIAGS